MPGPQNALFRPPAPIAALALLAALYEWTLFASTFSHPGVIGPNYNTPGTDWTVTSNYIKNSRVDGPATSYLRMGYNNGNDQGVGPGGGDATTAQVVSNFVSGSGTYNATFLQHRDIFKFNYQNANNYYMVYVLSYDNYFWSNAGDGFAAFGPTNNSPIAIAAVVNGNVHYLANGPLLGPSQGENGGVDLSLAWDAAANTIQLTITMTQDPASGGGTLIDHAVVNVTDPNLWESGKVGFQSSASSNTALDLASFEVLVPEPATMTMLVLGGIGALLRRRK